MSCESCNLPVKCYTTPCCGQTYCLKCLELPVDENGVPLELPGRRYHSHLEVWCALFPDEPKTLQQILKENPKDPRIAQVKQVYEEQREKSKEEAELYRSNHDEEEILEQKKRRKLANAKKEHQKQVRKQYKQREAKKEEGGEATAEPIDPVAPASPQYRIQRVAAEIVTPPTEEKEPFERIQGFNNAPAYAPTPVSLVATKRPPVAPRVARKAKLVSTIVDLKSQMKLLTIEQRQQLMSMMMTEEEGEAVVDTITSRVEEIVKDEEEEEEMK